MANTPPCFFRIAQITSLDCGLQLVVAPLEAYFVTLVAMLPISMGVEWNESYDIFATSSRFADAGSLTGGSTANAAHVAAFVEPADTRSWRTRWAPNILTRKSSRGIELTPAGRGLSRSHARLVLSQVEAAAEAARWVARPAKAMLASMGFLTRTRIDVDARIALQILRDELPNIDVMISSQYSPLPRGRTFEGKIDAGLSSTRTRGARLGLPPSGQGSPWWWSCPGITVSLLPEGHQSSGSRWARHSSPSRTRLLCCAE